LDGNETAAQVLSDEVFRTIDVTTLLELSELPDVEVDFSKLGIWIDPIDGTNEYIKGRDGAVFKNTLFG
jgi:inositol polyphosphate 1-phosphatase